MRFVVGSMIAVTFLFASSPSASADPVTIAIGDFTNGGTATLHAPGTLANNLSVELGGVTISGALGTFLSFCVDLQHYITPGVYTADVDTMANWNNQATPAHASLGTGAASWLYTSSVGQAAVDPIVQAGLSLAIWNSLYNDVYNVTTIGSGFWVTNASNPEYVTAANQLLQNLEAYTNANGVLAQASWLRTTNASINFGQDFIAPVPEPGTVMLLACGASLLMLGSWFRRPLPVAPVVRRGVIAAVGLLLLIPGMAAAFQPVKVPEPGTSALLVVSAVTAAAAVYRQRIRGRRN